MQVFCPFPPDLARCPEEIPNASPHALGLIDNRRLRNQVFRERNVAFRWVETPSGCTVSENLSSLAR